MSETRPVAEPSASAGLGRVVLQVLSGLAPAAGFVLLFVFFSGTAKGFLTTGNLTTIAVQIAVVAILAIGETFVIVSGGIDLSVGSVLALSGMTTALILTRWHDAPAGAVVPASILAGIGVGALCGLINGLLVTYTGLPSFIVTLGMMGICRGLAKVPTDAQATPALTPDFTWVGSGRLLNGLLPVPVLILAVVAIASGLILRYTRLGRYCYAMGSNLEAARLSGVNIRFYMTVVFVICGLLAGLAGVVGTGRLTIGDPMAGRGYELDSIAAAVIGGASLMGGVGTIVGTMLGAFIMAVLRNGCDLKGISPHWQEVVIGCVIILAVLVDRLRHRG
jgi:ribose transport system permease protein